MPDSVASGTDCIRKAVLYHAGKGADMYDESVAFQTSLTRQKMRPWKIPGVLCNGLWREEITWPMWV